MVDAGGSEPAVRPDQGQVLQVREAGADLGRAGVEPGVLGRGLLGGLT